MTDNENSDQREDSSEPLDRSLGIKVLKTVLKQTRNCEIFEKYIFKWSEGLLEKYKWYLYQTVGLILMDMDIKSTLKKVKDGNLGWKSPTYKNIRAKIDEHDEYLLHPFEVASGINICGKCGSDKVYSFAKQMRSADEATATICRCTCGNHWVQSGA